MAFAIPMLLLFLFGSVLTLDVNNLETVVFDQDRSQRSRELLDRFVASRYFHVRAQARGWGEVERALDSGRAQVALVIPPNFARDLERGLVTPIQAVVDGSDSNTATIALAYIDTITTRYSAPIAIELQNALANFTAVRYGREGALDSDALDDALAAGVDLTRRLKFEHAWPANGSAGPWSSSSRRRSGCRAGSGQAGAVRSDPAFSTCCSPWPPAPWSFGYRCGELLAAPRFLAAVPPGSRWGWACSSPRSRARSSPASWPWCTAALLHALGLRRPHREMPRALQIVSYAVPARYFVTALKGIFLKGIGLRMLWPQALFLAVFAAVVIALALRAFRKRLD
jgi:ABC-2 type transport system permease protein